jgi:hypothetical protein
MAFPDDQISLPHFLAGGLTTAALDELVGWLNALALRAVDTGWDTTTTVAAAHSSTAISSKLRRVGSFIEVQIFLTLGGASITVGSSGDCTNTVIANVPAPYRPSTVPIPLQSGSIGPLLSANIGTNGDLTITATDSNAVLSSGLQLSFTGIGLD